MVKSEGASLLQLLTDALRQCPYSSCAPADCLLQGFRKLLTEIWNEALGMNLLR